MESYRLNEGRGFSERGSLRERRFVNDLILLEFQRLDSENLMKTLKKLLKTLSEGNWKMSDAA